MLLVDIGDVLRSNLDQRARKRRSDYKKRMRMVSTPSSSCTETSHNDIAMASLQDCPHNEADADAWRNFLSRPAGEP